MPRSKEVADRVHGILVAALPGGMRVDVASRQQGTNLVFDVSIWAGATGHHFRTGWAGEGWPSDVERLAAIVPDVDVVVAVSLSDGARRWLSERKLGWADEAGHVEVSTPSGLVISRVPGPRPTRPEPPPRWARSVVAAAEAILSGGVPTVAGIGQATGLSQHAAATALDRLESLGFLERPAARRGPMSGRRVVDTAALLDAYAAAAARRRSQQRLIKVHRLWREDPLATVRAEIAPALTGASVPWVVTGTAASVLLAPYLSDVTVLELYVGAEAMANTAELAELLGGTTVEKGHRIEVRELPSPVAAKGPVIDGIPVALPVRVYADLTATGGRSAEAARALAEIALVRLVRAYGQTPELVLLGGLVPDILCGRAARQHVGTTDVDVQVDLESREARSTRADSNRPSTRRGSSLPANTYGAGVMIPSPAP